MTSQQQYKTAYLRDEFLPFEEANVSIGSSPVLYGLSVYTVFNAHYDASNNKMYAFRLEEHFKRLLDSCRIMGFNKFSKDYSFDKFKTVVEGLFSKNQPREDVLVRVTVFVDEVLSGLVINQAKNALSAYMVSGKPVMNQDGVKVGISSWNRTRDNSIPPRAKVNGNYVNGALMKNEANSHGYDEAISLTAEGYVSEGTIANVFMVKNKKIVTPASSDDILIGITRNTILQIARESGIECFERQISRTEIYTADEVFFTGSSAHVVPILEMDSRIISGKAGPITERLAKDYYEIRAGNNHKYKSWLTEVKL